jgi:hypothetical protein
MRGKGRPKRKGRKSRKTSQNASIKGREGGVEKSIKKWAQKGAKNII